MQKTVSYISWKTKNLWGFSIIEVLVGIFVFSLWLVSIFMLLSSSLNFNELNKNKIIASNLAREQIELVRNVRDSNYKLFYSWDQLTPTATTHRFEVGKYYTVENNFGPGFHVDIREIPWTFGEWVAELNGDMKKYRLYRTPEGIYTYDDSAGNTPTHFYRYLAILPLEHGPGDIVIPDSFRVVSKVIWYKRWYHDLDIETILADWRRI